VSPSAFAEIAIHYHGALGIYRENRWMSLVRVNSVSFDERMASLEIEEIPTPGMRSDHVSGWAVSSIWEYVTVRPTSWGQVYPSLHIEFDHELVEAVVAFAATLPPEYTPEHYPQLRQFVSEFHSNRRLAE